MTFLLNFVPNVGPVIATCTSRWMCCPECPFASPPSRNSTSMRSCTRIHTCARSAAPAHRRPGPHDVPHVQVLGDGPPHRHPRRHRELPGAQGASFVPASLCACWPGARGSHSCCSVAHSSCTHTCPPSHRHTHMPAHTRTHTHVRPHTHAGPHTRTRSQSHPQTLSLTPQTTLVRTPCRHPLTSARHRPLRCPFTMLSMLCPVL
jgi:hypothetical protein